MRVTQVGNGWQHYFTLKQQQKGVGEVQNEKIRAFLDSNTLKKIKSTDSVYFLGAARNFS